MNGYDLTNKMRKKRRRYPLTATEQALYNELVAICNEDEWDDIFSVSNQELCTALQITEKTLTVARLALIQAELLFYKSGQSKRQYGKYSFSNPMGTTVKFPVDATTNKGGDNTANNTANPTAISTDLEKTKLNETKLNEIKEGKGEGDKPPMPPQKKEVFKKPELSDLETFFLIELTRLQFPIPDYDTESKIYADTYFKYYESNGWKVGKNAMKDWKAAVTSWLYRELKDFKNKPKKDGAYQQVPSGQLNGSGQKPGLSERRDKARAEYLRD